MFTDRVTAGRGAGLLTVGAGGHRREARQVVKAESVPLKVFGSELHLGFGR